MQNYFHIQRLRFVRYLCITVAAFGVGVGAAFFLDGDRHGIASDSFNPQSALETIRMNNPGIFEGIRDNLSETIADGGIGGSIELTRAAFVNESITMYQCHTLNHLIGHKAVVYFDGKLEDIIKYDSDFCELGYRHGAEAQIVSEGAFDFREQLYSFCEAVRGKSPGASCYHGGGHRFMNETLNLEEAIALCDTLTEGPENNLTDCYKGVFSEYTNLVGGVDGETGLQFAGDPPLQLDAAPLDFCASLAEPYQKPCAFELNGLGFGVNSTLSDVERAVHRCTANSYNMGLQETCLYSIAAVSAQHELPAKGTVTLSPNILSLPRELRRAYIAGATSELREFLKSGAQKDWRGFCESFPEEDDRQFCEQRLTRQ